MKKIIIQIEGQEPITVDVRAARRGEEKCSITRKVAEPLVEDPNAILYFFPHHIILDLIGKKPDGTIAELRGEYLEKEIQIETGHDDSITWVLAPLPDEKGKTRQKSCRLEALRMMGYF